jgi:hypothetical protein
MSKIIAVFCCVFFMILAFIDVGAFVANARAGLMLFGNNVAPVLFPFFFISGLLIELNLFKGARAQKVGVVLMSYLSGYPTGARMISQLYTRGEITRTAAIKMATFTSTCSPIFIIATLGAALYQDVRLGVIIFISHIIAMLLTGLCTSFMWDKFTKKSRATPTAPLQNSADAVTRSQGAKPDVCFAVSNALTSAVSNILAVGGLIMVFFVASANLPWWAAAVLEMTTGVFRAEGLFVGIWGAVVPCVIVSFGGLCVAMQGYVFLGKFALPPWFYFAYKAFHAVTAGFIAAIIYLIL